MAEDVSVVVVTWNAAGHIEQCLGSVRGHETVVVDNGSTDGTVALVRERFPEVTVIEQENLGMGGGNNTGMRAAGGRYWLLLNSDAWAREGALEALVAFADAHPRAAVVGPRLSNPDGSLQRSVRGDPTLWRLATEYLFLRKLGPRTDLFNAFYGGGFAYDIPREVESLLGAALLVRREAALDVAERDDLEGGHRRQDRDDRREREQEADRAGRAELLLGEQLEDVGQRLQRAVGADAVRAVAGLEAPEQLALGEQHHRDELQPDGEDHDRLQDLDPPRFVVADGGQHRLPGAHTSCPLLGYAPAASRSCQRTPLPPICSSVRPS